MERTITHRLEKTAKEGEAFEDRIRGVGSFEYGKTSDGDMIVMSSKRSALEGKNYDPKGNKFDRKGYDTSKYETGSWEDRNKNFATSKWDGGKNYTKHKMDTPEFITKAKGFENSTWDERSKKYDTARSDQQGKVYEKGKGVYETHKNNYVDDRRDRLEKPRIMTVREHAAKTVAESRALLGRED